MPISLGTKGQANFTEPIALLMDCHRRIEYFLELLSRVVERYGQRELDDEGRKALETALNYFAQAAPRHTADEEESLFPRMRQCGDEAVGRVMAEIDALEADHRQAEVGHARVETIGRAWLETGRLSDEACRELMTLLPEMRATYTRHIRMEDEQVFTLASKVLDDEALQAVGREMKHRRAENPGRPGSRCAQRRQQIQSNP